MITLTNASTGERMLVNPRFVMAVFKRRASASPGGIFRMQANDCGALNAGNGPSITNVLIGVIHFEIAETIEDVQAMVAVDTRVSGADTGNTKTTLNPDGTVDYMRLIG